MLIKQDLLHTRVSGDLRISSLYQSIQDENLADALVNLTICSISMLMDDDLRSPSLDVLTCSEARWCTLILHQLQGYDCSYKICLIDLNLCVLCLKIHAGVCDPHVHHLMIAWRFFVECKCLV